MSADHKGASARDRELAAKRRHLFCEYLIKKANTEHQ
jgi:hypothetical protein